MSISLSWQATNHLELELGSDLRKLECVAKSFNPGSIVAELEIQVFATTQDIADSLADDVAELSSGEGLVLSSDGDSLSVSSFSATGTDGRLVYLNNSYSHIDVWCRGQVVTSPDCI